MSILKVKLSGINEVTKRLDKEVKKKIPFAVVKGINRAAFDVRDGLKGDLPKRLDRPTPFTMNAFSVKKAVMATRTAWVYLKPIQREYLKYQILGGTAYKRKVVPGRSYPLNSYGNLPKGVTKRKTTLVGKYKGSRAYYRTRGSGGNRTLQMIGWITGHRRYRRLFPFFLLAELHARRNIERKIRREVARVLN